MSSKKEFEKDCENKIKCIIKDLAERGLLVRREKLARGPSFKVKSGHCEFSGKKIMFIDRRLPLEAQLQLLEEKIPLD